jgi:nitronate monooxygenase
VLGADLVYMGTRFIACPESMVNGTYRGMLVRADATGVTATRAVTGVLCNWLNESLTECGYTDASLDAEGKIDFSDVHGEHKPWKDIFGAGQGVGAIDRIASMADVAAEVVAEYRAAVAGYAPNRPSALTRWTRSAAASSQPTRSATTASKAGT